MQIHEKTSTKQKLILILFGLFLCSVLLEVGLRIGGFILLSQQEYRNKSPINQKETYHIMCLGESTTFGGGGNSYPRQLERILNQRNSGIKFKVINKGVSSVTSTNIVSKLENNINRYNPDMIIVMMGINDNEDTVAYADIHSNKTALFLKSFRIYKLAKLLKLHIIHKSEEKKLVEEELLKKAIEINPRNYEAYVDLVDYYQWQEKFVEAEETRKKALEILPEHEESYVYVVDYYRGQEKSVEAEELLKEALEINPKSDEAYVDLAHYYWGQEKFIEAEELLKKALEINPKNDEAYVDLAHYYWGQEKFNEAQELFKKILKINPKNDAAYLDLAHYYWVQGKKVEAEELLKKALEINPKNYNAYYDLAEYYCGQEKFDEAEELLKKALEINPKNDATYIAYSNCPPRDDFVELEELVKKALEINPKNVIAYGKLAYYFQEQGKFDEAEELLKKALKINPEDANIYYYLQTLLYEKNKKRKAADGYSQKISEIDTGRYPPVTIQNYQILKNTVTNKGIKLVSMQYPVRNIEPLKKIFKSKEGLVFVDNEQIFKEAIARENYDKYFTDNFGGDFGHCTVKGNRLMAENVANVILKEFFKKK